MRNCKIDIWLENIDSLTSEEFDELIQHSTVCKTHSDVLTDYEQSILPILRASLPEKIISYTPMSRHRDSAVLKIWDTVLSEVKLVLRKIMIDVHPILYAWRKVNLSGVLQYGILGVLFIVTTVYASKAIFDSLETKKSLTSPLHPYESSKPQREQPGISYPPRRGISSGREAVGRISLSERNNIVNPVPGKYSPDVIVTFSNYPNPFGNSESNSDIKIPPTEEKNKKPEGTISDQTSVKRKTDMIVVSKDNEFIRDFPNSMDLKFAPISINIVNIGPSDIGHTICKVELARDPSINTMATPDRKGVCRFGLKISESYNIVIESVGFQRYFFELPISSYQEYSRFVVLIKEQNSVRLPEPGKTKQ